MLLDFCRVRPAVTVMCVCQWVVFFFFSSRRRHTRFKCDWSSDVCSSDLIPLLDQIPGIGDAFTQNLKGIVRTELIIFIRPQIIRDSVDASVVAEELRSKLRGGKIGSVDPPGAVVPPAPRLVR